MRFYIISSVFFFCLYQFREMRKKGASYNMYLNLAFRGNQCLPRNGLKQNNEDSSNRNGFEIIYLNN